MQKIFRNGIKRTIATQFSPKLVNSCMVTRSVSSQISLQNWPWTRQPLTPPSPSSYLHYRCYSTDNDDPPEQQIPNTQRKIPKMSDTQIEFAASPFSFIVLNFKAFKIRKYDPEFSINEFVEGSKKAVEVVSDKLASGDYDGLRGLITDDLIDELRERLSTWTVEQRTQLRSNADDICRAILRAIDVVEEDDRLLVKMSMVYHVVEGFEDLTQGKFDGKFQNSKLSARDFLLKSSEFLDQNFQILNYTFIKEFSKDSNDDWIISYVNHANIHDEMMEHQKVIDETMRRMREKKK